MRFIALWAAAMIVLCSLMLAVTIPFLPIDSWWWVGMIVSWVSIHPANLIALNLEDRIAS